MSNAVHLLSRLEDLQFLSGELEAWCKVCSEEDYHHRMQELELIHRHQTSSVWRYLAASKVDCTQRLQLCVFQQDVQQVMDWIENHGEAFLSKHTGVGKSLHRARALQKRHDDFEDVAQNTYTNADKLLEAASSWLRLRVL
ncbi:kalirin isoform X2 [Lates japonicus]|uniref:Kalirin isoform X2 n=1 Tax=Lates japonicus TaxID=270547 RepID=A0AAD3NI63_LATJO|nr:kalirin isoform X2 [Lates japonicus]